MYRSDQFDCLESYRGVIRKRPLTCLGDAAELSPGKGAISSFSIAMPRDYGHRSLTRKWWEWDYISACVDELNISNDALVVGLGAGHEPLMHHFTNRFHKVVATDLYSSETNWAEAKFGNLKEVKDSSPIPFKKDRLDVLNADMRSVPMDAGTVDLIWSCSSIEHIYCFKDFVGVFKEISRLLKPGGYAVLTTEFCLGSGHYHLPHLNSFNEDTFAGLLGCIPELELVGDTYLSFNYLHPANAPRGRRYTSNESLEKVVGEMPLYLRHIGNMATPLGISITVPIAFTLRKTSSSVTDADWRAVALPNHVSSYVEGLIHFENEEYELAQGKFGEAVGFAGSDLQMAIMASRFHLDAHVRAGSMTRPKVINRVLDEFLTIVPDGDLHDADCIDLLGYILGEMGRHSEAMDVFEKALFSPSTNLDHIKTMIERFRTVASRANETERAENAIALIVADLKVQGTNFKL